MVTQQNAVVVFRERLEGKERDTVRNILFESDGEFFPPLSERSGTMQKEFGTLAETPWAYFDDMAEQEIAIAYVNGEIAGFVSFLPAGYMTTAVVRQKYRRTGIFRRLLREVWNRFPFTYCRTWSGNTACINALKSLGYEVTFVTIDDRGKGEDTIFFRSPDNRNWTLTKGEHYDKKDI